MRVEKVNTTSIDTGFCSKPKCKRVSHRYESSFDDYMDMEYCPPVKFSKVIDVNYIKALESEIRDDEKPLSFKDSHAKFTLDRYQKEAVDSYIEDSSTIVTAPTGMGKTLIAEYGIDDALKKGKKLIYLTPLKALSNDKFVQFSKLFGTYDEKGNLIDTKNVGIVTGDVSINPDAPIVVMTTEIYRNILNTRDEKSADDRLKDYSGVIYDEFHYLDDPQRGTVWEESVINTPRHMRQLMLSATASNSEEIAQWMRALSPDKKVKLINVPENERYVPLKQYVYATNSRGEHLIEPIYEARININTLADNLSDRQKETAKELEKLYNGKDLMDILHRYLKSRDSLISADYFADKLQSEKGLKKDKAEQIAYVLSDSDSKREKYLNYDYTQNEKETAPLVRLLTNKKMTPALFFVFSKKGCKKHMDEAINKVGTLLTPKESKQVLDIIDKAKENGIYLGEDFDEKYLSALLMGFSVHHAGMLPAYKSLVEKLARKGLIKVCFATETMLAGINMPFKTVVFTSPTKYDGNDITVISPTTFIQGAGRAGRRGIDNIGSVIVMPRSRDDFDTYKYLINSKDTKIKSAFSPSYASLLNSDYLNSFDEKMKKSLFYYQNSDSDKKSQALKKKIDYLKEKGYIEQKQGKNILTEKGNSAKNIYGINQVLLGELMSNPDYTKDMYPSELASLMTIFADIKDENATTSLHSLPPYVREKFSPVIELAKTISQEQLTREIDEPINMSTNLASAILEFAREPNDNPLECLETWKAVFNDFKEDSIILHEGDLIRVVNGTIDLLDTISKTSYDQELAQKAKDAIKSLKKPPVTDILRYELNVN